MKFKNEKPAFKNTHNECLKVNGKEYWLSRSSAVVAFVKIYVKGDGDYILIGQRGTGTPDYQGYWNLPCGYLDKDESLKEAAIREVYEETGLYVGNTDEFETTEQPIFVNSDPISSNRQNVSNYFLFKTEVTPATFKHIQGFLTNENSEPDEVADLRFVKLSDVKDYDFCFNHDERIKMIPKFEAVMAVLKTLD